MKDEQYHKNARAYEAEHRITVGELLEQLKGYSKDTEISFGNTLNGTPQIFNRIKHYGDKLVYLELNEVTKELLEQL